MTFFPNDIFQHRPHHQERKEEICNFSQSTGAKNQSTCLPRAVFLRQPESHTLEREGAWPTFWCRASTSRLVQRRLALLSLCQSSPNPASPFYFFVGISISMGLLSASNGSSLPWPRPVCALGRPLLHLQSLFLFGSRHTKFFFHSCDPTSL